MTRNTGLLAALASRFGRLTSAQRFAPLSLLVALQLAISSPAHAQTPTHLWSGVFGSAYIQDGKAVAIDKDGNSYFAGQFDNLIDFSDGGFGKEMISVDGLDIFFVKFDPLGNYLWSRKFGGAGNQYASSLATDSAGNVYLAGYFYGAINLGGGLIAGRDGADAFLAKYAPDGNLLWQVNTHRQLDQAATCVCTDSADNVYLGGHFEGLTSFGSTLLVSAGSFDMFIAKFDSNGTSLWARRFGDSDNQRVHTLAVDLAGNVFLLGEFGGTIDFGTGPLTSVGLTDIALAKFDPSGACLWSRQYGTAAEAVGNSLATDRHGNAIIGGHFLSYIDFGGGYHFEQGGLYDIFVAKIDPNGTYLWSKDFGDDNWDDLGAITTDADGSIYLHGQFRGQLNFGGDTLVSSDGALLQPYLAALDENGDHEWSELFPGNNVQATGMARFGDALCITGLVVGPVDFGGGVLTSSDTYYDVYAARFSLPVPTAIRDGHTSSTLSISAYPNPFNPRTTIRYTLPSNGRIKLAIYDASGALVTTLFDGEQSAGGFVQQWSGRNDAGRSVSSGIYFARLAHPSGTRSYKLIVLK